MACLNGSTPVTSQASLPSAKIGAREVSLVGDASGLMVKNGFTFTSPSVYLGVPAISAVDACGLLGEARTSITIGVAPGELSTYRGIGDTFSYNFADILCPPVEDNDAFSFLGQGYRPLISPPARLRNLDPLWSNCNLGPFQGNDPPKALNPVAVMDPMTTAVDPAAVHLPATPASVPSSPPTSTASGWKAADPNPNVVPLAEDPQTVHPSPAPVPADPPTSDSDRSTAASASPDPKVQPQPEYPKVSSSADPKIQPQPGQENNSGNSKGSGPVDPKDQTRPSPGNSLGDPKVSNAVGLDPPSHPNRNQNSQDQPPAAVTSQHIPGPSVIIPGPTGVNNKPDILSTAAANRQETPNPVIVGSLTFSPLAIPSITVNNNPAGAPQGSAIAVVAGQTVHMGLSGVEVNSMTLTPGAAPITVSGTPVSVGKSRVVIGGDTYSLPSPTPAPVVTAAGQVITAAPSELTFGAATLTPGGPPVVISGTPISLGSSTLLIGSRTIALPSSSVLAVAGVTFTANPSGFQVGGTTLTRGGAPVTISGTVVSLGSSTLLVGSSAVPLPPDTNTGILTVPGGQVFTTNVNGFVVGSTTLYQGGPAVTISGTVASFGPSGLIVGSSTISLASTPSVFVVGGQSFTANPTGFSIAGTSISAGGPGVTISGTPVSLSPSGLVISTNTYQLLDVFTVGGHIFTANPTGFAMDGTTISPGGPGITVAGTPVSLGASNTLFIGSSANPLHTESSQGLGPAILSGLGPINPIQTSSRPNVNGTVQSYDGSYATLNTAKLIRSLFTALLCIIFGVLM